MKRLLATLLLLVITTDVNASPKEGTYVVNQTLLPNQGYTYELSLLGHERTQVNVTAAQNVPIRCIVYVAGSVDPLTEVEHDGGCSLVFYVPTSAKHHLIVMNRSQAKTDALITVQ